MIRLVVISIIEYVYLAANRNLVISLVSYWTLIFVFVVEHNSNCCSSHASLTLLVNKLLQRASSYLLVYGESQECLQGPNDFLGTCSSLDIPRTKQIESNMFDFPLPFKPVIALNMGSNPSITVRFAYDCGTISLVRGSKSQFSSQ